MLRPCILSSYVELRSVVSEEKSKRSQAIRGRGGHLVFPINPKKITLGRERWDLAPCQVSLNSVQWFQRRSKIYLSQSEAGAANLVFLIDPENTNMVEWDIASCQDLLNSIQRFQRIENVLANQTSGKPSCFFSDWHEKDKLGRGHWDLASCQVSLNSV